MELRAAHNKLRLTVNPGCKCPRQLPRASSRIRHSHYYIDLSKKSEPLEKSCPLIGAGLMPPEGSLSSPERRRDWQAERDRRMKSAFVPVLSRPRTVCPLTASPRPHPDSGLRSSHVRGEGETHTINPNSFNKSRSRSPPLARSSEVPIVLLPAPAPEPRGHEPPDHMYSNIRGAPKRHQRRSVGERAERSAHRSDQAREARARSPQIKFIDIPNPKRGGRKSRERERASESQSDPVLCFNLSGSLR